MSEGVVTDREGFAAFVEKRWKPLVRLGWALTGDLHLGEDLAQATLDRLWRRWPRVSANGDPWPYTQRIAVSIAATWRRRRWRGELPMEREHNEVGGVRDPADLFEDRDALLRWLRGLAPRQRSVIILRFLDDLSVEETAARVGCSTGTVKSQTARALDHLRELAEMDRTREEDRR
jgi:RNA polymerase sigma-70 factor (sigma-E family)